MHVRGGMPQPQPCGTAAVGGGATEICSLAVDDANSRRGKGTVATPLPMMQHRRVLPWAAAKACMNGPALTLQPTDPL